MPKITIYEKPTCTTCRKVNKILRENNVDFDKVNYYIEPFSKNKLRTLFKKMDMKPEDLLRKREKAYKKLDLKNKKYTKEELIEKMVENPDLIERPIVQKGEKVILARPPEKINELF